MDGNCTACNTKKEEGNFSKEKYVCKNCYTREVNNAENIQISTESLHRNLDDD